MMSLETTLTAPPALWPLSPLASPTLADVTAGSAAVETPTTSAGFVTAWETLSSGSGGTIDATGVVGDIDATLSLANGGTAPVVVIGGKYKNLSLNDVQNLRFQDITQSPSTRKTRSTYPPAYEIWVSDCVNVQFVNCSFIYDPDNSLKQEYYLSTSGVLMPLCLFFITGTSCRDILIDQCYIQGYFNAIVFDYVNIARTGVLEVLNTEIKYTQNDNFRGGGWNSIRVEGCYCHTNYPMDYSQPDGQHSDRFQVWAYAGDTCGQITLKNNLFISTTSGGQGAFFNVGAGGVIDGVTVENNLFYGQHLHGISFYSGVSNGIIRRNTVLYNPEATITNTPDATQWPGNPTSQDWGTFRIWDRGDALIEDNIADSYNLFNHTGIATGNIDTEMGDGSNPLDAINHFVNPYAFGAVTLADLRMRPDSPYYGVKGATIP